MQPEQARHLRKSDSEKMLFGVAGGLAEYFDIDAVLVRVGFIALVFGGGSGLIVYIALAVLMPGASDEHRQAGPGDPGKRQRTLGLAVIVIGGLLLLATSAYSKGFPGTSPGPLPSS